MGIKRGDFESVGLGALAQSANPSYHQHASIAPGLGALARGMVAYADGWGYIKNGLEDWSRHFWQMSEMAKKANMRQEAYKSMEATANKQLEQYCETHDKDTWENDAQYWRLQDNVNRYKGLQAGNTIFGNLSEPDVTKPLDERQKTMRGAAYLIERTNQMMPNIENIIDTPTKKDEGMSILDWDKEKQAIA